MEPLEHDSASARLGTAAELLAYLAVAPLLVCLAAVAALPEYAQRELAQRAAVAWGAVLLTFSGAVHFGLAIVGRARASAARLAAAVLPGVIGAAAIVIGGQRALALLTVGWGLFWLYEHRVIGAALPAAYLSLRRNLSLAACTLLALTMIACDSAGLL